MNPKSSLAFVRRHGVVLESGRGPVLNLAQTIAREPIRGNWWGHAKGREIFRLTRAIRSSRDVLVCRLISGKITYVHRRLWPAVVRLARSFPRDRLAALHEVHTPQGQHELREEPFPRWVSSDVRRRARRLSEDEARKSLGEWCVRGAGLKVQHIS